MAVDQWHIAHLSSFGPYKHNGLCFSDQRRFMVNKEKGDVFSIFFPYSKFMEVDQWSIARLSSFGHTSILVYVFLSNAVL